MKKIAVFLAVLLLLAAPVLAAEPTEALSDVLGADELTQSLPDEAAEVLDAGFRRTVRRTSAAEYGASCARRPAGAAARCAVAFACARCCWPWLRCAPSCA